MASTMDAEIILGDALNLLDGIKGGTIDCLFTSPDPPKTGSDLMRLQFIFEKVRRVMHPRGVIWVHMGDFHNQDGTLEQMPQRFALHMTGQLNWLKRSEIIWHRAISQQDAQRSREDSNRFIRNYDYIMMFTASRYGYYFENNSLFSLSSVITEAYQIPHPGEFESGFPESIIASCICISCPEGGTVLDPFAGTGTTGLVALKIGRKFIGFDKDAGKVVKIRQRLGNLS